jgi:preprotein translocase subunit SecF
MALRLFPDGAMTGDVVFKFYNKRLLFIAISIILNIAALVAVFTNGLNFGIDFKGGSLIEARASAAVDVAKLRENIDKSANLAEFSLQTIGSPQDISIKFLDKQNTPESNQAAVNEIKDIMKSTLGTDIVFRKTDHVGPQVGKELIEGSAMAIALALAAIVIYVWVRYEWQFGAGALFALLHDAIMTLGFYAVTGLEFNLTSVAAILTIVGYSVNDTVVIFDRIREYMRK